MTPTLDELGIQGADRLDRVVGLRLGSSHDIGPRDHFLFIFDMGQNTSTIGAKLNLVYAMQHLIYLVIYLSCQLVTIFMFHLSFSCLVNFISFYTNSRQDLPVFMTNPFSFASFLPFPPQVLREGTLVLSLDIWLAFLTAHVRFGLELAMASPHISWGQFTLCYFQFMFSRLVVVGR